jgi:hypothetical protein
MVTLWAMTNEIKPRDPLGPGGILRRIASPNRRNHSMSWQEKDASRTSPESECFCSDLATLTENPSALAPEAVFSLLRLIFSDKHNVCTHFCFVCGKTSLAKRS